jgi:ABC-type bacteriocin/lantibiotic exporter with double-glycine peptidase domain
MWTTLLRPSSLRNQSTELRRMTQFKNKPAPSVPPSLLGAMKALFSLLSRKRKLQLLLLAPALLVGALAEMASIAAIVPFLTLISDPENVLKIPGFAWLLAQFELDLREDGLKVATLLFVVIVLVAGVTRLGIAYVTEKLGASIGADLQASVYTRLLYQPYSFHVQRNTSESISDTDKASAVTATIILPTLRSITNIVLAVFIIVGVFLVNPWVAVAAGLGFSLIYFFVSVVTRSQATRISHVQARVGPTMLKARQEALGGIRDVLLDRSQPIYVSLFRSLQYKLVNASVRRMVLMEVPRVGVESLGVIFLAGLAFFMTSRVETAVGVLPALGALALGAQRLLPLMQQTYNNWISVASSHYLLLDVVDALRRPIDAKYEVAPDPLALPFRSSIVVDKVEFRYTPATPVVLKGLSLSIRKGQRIGLIGKTGCGKSTLTDIIMGLLEPTDGALLVDGQPITKANVGHWQAHIAHVPQAIYLSDTSLAENIAFGVPVDQIDMQRVRRAARQAEVSDFIEALEDGYQTFVGERGVRLSGGQRQRIGIARALYRQASVLILDEATSALDNATEAAVMQSIEALADDLTIIMIAHRLSTLDQCDVIFRLESGRVVEVLYPKQASVKAVTTA